MGILSWIGRQSWLKNPYLKLGYSEREGELENENENKGPRALWSGNFRVYVLHTPKEMISSCSYSWEKAQSHNEFLWNFMSRSLGWVSRISRGFALAPFRYFVKAPILCMRSLLDPRRRWNLECSSVVFCRDDRAMCQRLTCGERADVRYLLTY